MNELILSLYIFVLQLAQAIGLMPWNQTLSSSGTFILKAAAFSLFEETARQNKHGTEGANVTKNIDFDSEDSVRRNK